MGFVLCHLKTQLGQSHGQDFFHPLTILLVLKAHDLAPHFSQTFALNLETHSQRTVLEKNQFDLALAKPSLLFSCEQPPGSPFEAFMSKTL